MGQELAGKVAIVTGGASGLGRATVELFVEEGAAVVIADVDDGAGEKLAAELGAAAAFKRTDVADADQVQAAVDLAVENFDGLHIMINDAGISGAHRNFLDDDFDDFERTMAVNLFGVMVGSQRAARHMAEHDGGSIVNITSIGGINAGPRDPPEQIDRGRAGATRRPRELHRTRPHPDGDQCRVRPGGDRAGNAAAAAPGVATRHRRSGALPGERSGGAGDGHPAAGRRGDDRRPPSPVDERRPGGAHERS
jgi:NAD(P)-dependent dehydrogenase (short-subunit alcohol dehydrogenase family)